MFQVPLSDVWLSNCISDVSEVTLDPTTSFVIGWPISNAVITFRYRNSPSLSSLISSLNYKESEELFYSSIASTSCSTVRIKCTGPTYVLPRGRGEEMYSNNKMFDIYFTN